MATPTTNQGVPIPDPTDADNVPFAISQAVGTIEPRLVMRFTTSTARDTILTSPVKGMIAYLSTPDLLTVYNGTSWKTLAIPGSAQDVAGVPFAMAAGTINVTLTAAASGSTAVTFPGSRFSQAPRVSVTITSAPGGSQKFVARATAVTTTGMTVVVYTGDQTTQTATVPVDWIAVQMTNAASSG